MKLTVDATMSPVCSPSHLRCTVHLDVLNYKVVSVQTLQQHEASSQFKLLR